MMKASQTKRVGVILDPLDALFFRDGRPFEAGYRVGGEHPSPQTLAGALRTALLSSAGFDFGAFSNKMRNGKDVKGALLETGAPEWVVNARFRGPWFAFEKRDASCDPLLPVPASLSIMGDGEEKVMVRSDPLKAKIPGWDPGPEFEGLRPLWSRGEGKAEQPGGFLRISGIRKFLEGKVPDESDHVKTEEVFRIDYRTGIVIDGDTLATEEGKIYSAGMTAFMSGGKEKVVLYCEALFPDAPENADDPFSDVDLLPFGGQSRYVRCQTTDPVDWPDGTRNGSGERQVALLATPGIFAGGWRPDQPKDASWIAAAVPGSLAVSGWDVAKGGPKPTRFAVQAGSVYFCNDKIEENTDSLCGKVEDAAQGWGFALRGVWNYV